MGHLHDLTGRRFGRLIVLYEIKERTNDGAVKWVCQCDCGNKSNIRSKSKTGETQSCGCINKEQLSKAKFKHGYSRKTTVEYRAWKAMRQRCYNQNYEHYKHYGGRGIKVCGSWLNSFECFLIDMGRKPSKKHSLDRVRTDGDYGPENCRWATQIEQTNNKRNNHWIEHNNMRKTLSQWKVFLRCNNLSRSMKLKSFPEIYEYYTRKNSICQ